VHFVSVARAEPGGTCVMSSTRTRAEFEKEEEEEEEAFVLVVVVLVLRAAKSALLFPLVRFHFGTFLCAWIDVVDVPVRRAARVVVVVVVVVIIIIIIIIVSRAARILPSLFLLSLSLSFRVQN
jgi:hypothetical protein